GGLDLLQAGDGISRRCASASASGGLRAAWPGERGASQRRQGVTKGTPAPGHLERLAVGRVVVDHQDERPAGSYERGVDEARRVGGPHFGGAGLHELTKVSE